MGTSFIEGYSGSLPRNDAAQLAREELDEADRVLQFDRLDDAGTTDVDMVPRSSGSGRSPGPCPRPRDPPAFRRRVAQVVVIHDRDIAFPGDRRIWSVSPPQGDMRDSRRDHDTPLALASGRDHRRDERLVVDVGGAPDQDSAIPYGLHEILIVELEIRRPRSFDTTMTRALLGETEPQAIGMANGGQQGGEAFDLTGWKTPGPPQFEGDPRRR